MQEYQRVCPTEMELVIASSPVDAGISCWDLNSGAEHLRYKSCISPSNGLTCVGGRFLASSQLRDSSASSGSILYWSLNKPTPEVKSFPAVPISPLVSNTEGTYLIGGGANGDIFLWEVASGRLLVKWHAHYRAVTCLVYSEDESLLVSGSEDGSVRVWNLINVFDDSERETYLHSFSGHSLRVTGVVIGNGGSNAIIISSSEDRTCKVWSLSTGIMLRTIEFPSIIDAIALDPGEHVFYAGSKDGKIYIGALNAENTSKSIYGLHIIGALFEQSKAVTCLALNIDGNLLVSGLVDGTIRIWNTKTQQIIRMLKHLKGTVNNVVVRRSLANPQTAMKIQSSRKHASSLPPPLEKYSNSGDDNVNVDPVVALPVPCSEPPRYQSFDVMMNQIKELQQQGSSAASEAEMERLRRDCEKSMQMTQKWKKLCEDLQKFCVDDIVDGDRTIGCNGNAAQDTSDH